MLIINNQYPKPSVFKSMTKYSLCSKPVPVATIPLAQEFSSKPRKNSLNTISKSKTYYTIKNNVVVKETRVIYHKSNKCLKKRISSLLNHLLIYTKRRKFPTQDSFQYATVRKCKYNKSEFFSTVPSQ